MAPAITAPYTWIFALSCVASFICAFGIGANDVANSFASSVGAKALTMPQSIMVAAVCEFAGAVLLGSGVTDTIKGGIAKPSTFAATPDLFMYGFFCVMLAAGFWDNFSCHLHLPVSTTHTTVGATIGMALAIYGGDAVQWAQKKKEFPFYGGMVPIVLTWFVSPIIAGVFVLVMFGFLRTFVLRSPHSFARALWVLPGCVGLLLFVLTVFIAQTYYKNKLGFAATKLPGYLEGRACWIGAVVAAVGVVATVAVAQLVLKKRIQGEDDRMQASAAPRKAALAECGEGATDADKAGALKALADVDAAADQPSAFSQKCAAAWNNFRATRIGDLLTNNAVSRTISHGANYKVHDHVAAEDDVARVWEHAEVFDYKTERLFRYLQILTACAMSFAHGSNDVANAMGPFAAVYQTWSTGATPGSNTPVPYWILAVGGAGIVVGLSTYGYKIMAVLAVKSVKLTNARGFCVELASALTVVLASRFGLPVSTTQVVCGAVMAVGLFEGVKGVNWRMAARIFIGWILTLIVACGVAAFFAAFGVYSPNKTASMAAAGVRKAAAAAAKAAAP